MEGRVIVACLFLVAVVRGEQAPTGLCRANERFLECGGCQKTCSDPAPANCAAVCRTGCYCEEGQVRNASGLCVDLYACPPIKAAYKQDTTEPRPNGGRCPANEEYRFCEPCNRTCDNRNPICPAQCARGCFCKTGLLRDRNGRCVTPEKCPSIPAPNATKHEMTCGKHQVYRQCQTQVNTCSDPYSQVPSPCVAGCYCVEGYVKAPNGQCVRLEECPKGPMNYKYVESKAVNTPNRTISQEVLPLPVVPAPNATKHEMTCEKHQVYKQCQTQVNTCSDPYSQAPSPCVAGCYCAEGYVKAPNGQCVRLEDCPKGLTPTMVHVHPMFGVVIFDSQPSHHDPSVEDCAPNEEYFTCGWCEPSCSDPTPNCPIKVCIRGCLCRPPLLRRHNGQCVDWKDCYPQKCSSPNEEYVCLFGCEPRCDGFCQQPPFCVFGCYCRLGLVRDKNGLCVIKERCSNSTEVQGKAVTYDKSTVVNYDKIN